MPSAALMAVKEYSESKMNTMNSNANLEQAAKQVLQANSHDTYTVPSSTLYPFQWNWDSGFIALGWNRFDDQRGWTEISTLLDWQWDNGKVPHIVFHKESDMYMPGPDHWHGEGTDRKTSGITQPPVLATIVKELYRTAEDKALALKNLKELFPKLVKYSEWFLRRRDPGCTGLVACFHPWETGLDNSPSWDEAVSNVCKQNVPNYIRKDTTHVNAAQRPSDRDYDSYMALVHAFQVEAYDQEKIFNKTTFRVIDLVTNCILLQSNRDLLYLAKELNDTEAASHIEMWINRQNHAIRNLWDSDKNAFLNVDTYAGKRIPTVTLSTFMPLYAGAASQAQAEILGNKLRSWMDKVSYIVPSTDPNEAVFESQRYWRGPVWINTNWMIAKGFEDYGMHDISSLIKEHSKKLVEEHGFHEYFDSVTGEGCGIKEFSWTASLALHWLLRD